MGIDSDDRLLRDGKGLNSNHETKLKDRVLEKSFLPPFNYDNTVASRFHYTSPEGLMGILKTRTFFFTDSQFLNDYREKININDILKSFWNMNVKEYEKAFVDLLSCIRVNHYEDSGFSYSDSLADKTCRYFVLSLSMDGDCLSMWKYYSKNGGYNGYCIQVRDIALSDEWIDRDTGAAIISSKVEYHAEDKLAIIRKVVDQLYSIWLSYERSERLDSKIVKEYFSWLSVEALFFKDECFKDERETRYVAIVPTEQLNHLCYDYKGNKIKMYDFRLVDGMYIPYIKMPFNQWNVDDCWAVESIRIGPSGNDVQKKDSLKRLIQSLDYELKECKILKSEIPVRY